MPGVYFSKIVILGLILLSPRLSGVVLSSSSLRGDGNPNLKGSKAFQQPEDRCSVLQFSVRQRRMSTAQHPHPSHCGVSEQGNFYPRA